VALLCFCDGRSSGRIADKWSGNAEDAEHWPDSHFRVDGPIVAQLQATFLDNRTNVSGEVERGADYLPSIEPTANARVQMAVRAR
jgi:cardiolipin synthase